MSMYYFYNQKYNECFKNCHTGFFYSVIGKMNLHCLVSKGICKDVHLNIICKSEKLEKT